MHEPVNMAAVFLPAHHRRRVTGGLGHELKRLVFFHVEIGESLDETRGFGRLPRCNRRATRQCQLCVRVPLTGTYVRTRRVHCSL